MLNTDSFFIFHLFSPVGGQPPLGANPPLYENHHLKGTGQRLIKPKDRRQCSVISYLCEKDWEPTTRVMSEELSSVFKKPTLKCKLSVVETTVYFFFFSFIFISWRLITSQHCSGFCHTLTWISHGVTCNPHPDPPTHLPLHPIPLGLPSAPGPSTCLMHPTWASDLRHYR